jgi:hypothetical protein
MVTAVCCLSGHPGYLWCNSGFNTTSSATTATITGMAMWLVTNACFSEIIESETIVMVDVVVMTTIGH